MKKLTIIIEIPDPDDISITSTSENLTGLESLGLISIIDQHIRNNAFNKKDKSKAK
jgi:hypothetical protein